MSYKYNLIIKNGSCFINGEIKKTDLALKENKISSQTKQFTKTNT